LFYGPALTAVDPAAANMPIPITTQHVAGAAVFRSGAWNLTSGPSDSGRIHAIVYAVDGTLWKLRATQTGTLPQPERFSTESGLNKVCDGTQTHTDFANADRSTYLYELPGADGVCQTRGDNQWRMVTLATATQDNPLPAYAPISPLRDPSNGALIGWLAIDGNSLSSYNAQFQNPALLSSFRGDVETLSVTLTAIALRIDEEIRIYTTSTANLSPPIHTRSDSVQFALNDGQSLYFLDGSTLYTAPFDGSRAATPLVTEANTVGIGNVTLTPGKLVYTARDITQNLTAVKAIAKEGGVSVAIANYALNQTLFLAGSAASSAYFNIFSPSGRSALYIRDDGGEKREISAAWWAGSTLPTSANGSASMVLIEGYTANGAFANGRLTAYDAGSDSVKAELGNLPSDIQSVAVTGVGENVLLRGLQTTQQSDILFANVTTPGSLQRVTASPSESEVPMDF
jgi:hypothetical protein